MGWNNAGWRSDDGGWYKNAAAGSAFSGAGDVVSGASFWVSPARAYTAAYATGSNACMDLVDQAGANPITINILSTGFVDLTAISNWVAAHTVTTIKVTKLYDQTGNGLHPVQATLATMPTLTLSALNGLPSVTFSGTQALVTAGVSGAISQPYAFSAVAERTGVTTGYTTILGTGLTTQAVQFGFNNTATAVYIFANSALPFATASPDSAYHAIQGTFNSASSNIYIDGSANTVDLTGAGFTTNFNDVLHVGTDHGGTGGLVGGIMEVGIWPLDFTASSRQSLVNSNQHGVNGYNF